MWTYNSINFCLSLTEFYQILRLICQYYPAFRHNVIFDPLPNQFFFIILFQAHAIGIRGVEQGLEVKINRIVLQTLTFTSGTGGIAPAYHGSILLSDSRHGNYLINKTRSLMFTTTLPPLIFFWHLSNRINLPVPLT